MNYMFLLLSSLLMVPAVSLSVTDQKGHKAINVKTSVVPWKGRQALRVTDAVPDEDTGRRLVVLPGSELVNGTIELEVAGDVMPGTTGDARGFVGVAFRTNAAAEKFESFYIRPTNGRAEDQLRRNHAVQYHAIPDFPWHKLREETPAKYETYADMQPGEWTKLRIEVAGAKARLFVADAKQPTMIVNDLKHGEGGGAVALWIGVGTVAHFSNVRITSAK